ncbi:MAG: endonuclease III [Candidatus Puniceispirillum sp.]|nr:endonuclease III [Candidatus Puniceispirillum sp.]
MTPQEIETLFERFEAANPAPQSELVFTNPYTLLVAVVLSAQATDKGVNKATKALFEKVTTPQEMLALGEDALMDHIKTIGLYPTKGRNIMALSCLLVERFGGQVPQTREALMGLPGVGRKTANVVLSVAFGQEALAVDTHILRVSRRLGLSGATTPDGVEADLMKVIPKRFLRDAHHWLILHGRYTCVARKPKCDVCPVYDLCSSSEKVFLP